MRIRGRVCHVDSPEATWLEEFDFPDLPFDHRASKEEAKRRVRRILKQYNNTLRPGEKLRKLVATKVLGVSTTHLWEKSNLVTIAKRGGASYDTARCLNCGATSRRYGLTAVYTLDDSSKRVCKKGR